MKCISSRRWCLFHTRSYLSHEIIPYIYFYFFIRRISIVPKVAVERYDNVQFSLIKWENFDAWILNVFETQRNTRGVVALI